jgi:hypothetical protein
MDRDREVLAKRLEGERAAREELQGELSKLQRQTQALENIEEMLFKERAQRQRAERSIVELARSLGTLKAALLHAGVPVPPEARPSSALQNTVQVPPPARVVHRIACLAPAHPPAAPRTTCGCLLAGKDARARSGTAAAVAPSACSRPPLFRALGCSFSHPERSRCAQGRPRRQPKFSLWNRSKRAG